MMKCKKSAERRKADPIEFKVDRPFLFYIREIRQDITLFFGKFFSSP